MARAFPASSPAMARQAERLKPFLDAFGPQDLRDWCAGLGEDTFVGSSGRVFPKSFKASPLAARLAAAARRAGRKIAPASRFSRLRRARRSVRDAARPEKGRGRCFRCGAGRSLLASPWRRWELGRAAGRSRPAVQPVAAGQQRAADRLVAAFPREIRGPAAEEHRVALRRFFRARRMRGDQARP